MSVSHCRVRYLDAEGIEHAVEVDADSLYEAVALAVSEFREQDLDYEEPKIMTEFTVCVFRKPTEHRIRLQQVREWAKHTVQEGPVGILKRDRVRKLLGIEWSFCQTQALSLGKHPLGACTPLPGCDHERMNVPNRQSSLGKAPGDGPEDTVTASELKDFTYRRRAWFLNQHGF